MDSEAALRFLHRALAAPWGPSSDHELTPGLAPPPGRTLRPAAILVLADLSAPEARLLLTKRAAHLRHHPGQVACPGGRLEPGEDARTAALREADEEVGLPRALPQVLGTFGPHETVTGFSVTAVVAALREPVAWTPHKGEVEEVFALPLAHVADLSAYRVEGRDWGGRRRLYWVLPFGPHYVWGATARMLRALAERGTGGRTTPGLP